MTKIDFTRFEDLSELIRILEASKSAGFDLNSSLPIIPLMEIIEDIALQINQLVSDHWHDPANTELQFLDFDTPDPLGNSKQRKVRVDHKVFDENNKVIKTKWEECPTVPLETLKEFFMDLAEAMIRLKSGHLNRSFMERLSSILNFDEYSSDVLKLKKRVSEQSDELVRLKNENVRLSKSNKMLLSHILLTRNEQLRFMKFFRSGD